MGVALGGADFHDAGTDAAFVHRFPRVWNIIDVGTITDPHRLRAVFIVECLVDLSTDFSIAGPTSAAPFWGRDVEVDFISFDFAFFKKGILQITEVCAVAFIFGDFFEDVFDRTEPVSDFVSAYGRIGVVTRHFTVSAACTLSSGSLCLDFRKTLDQEVNRFVGAFGVSEVHAFFGGCPITLGVFSKSIPEALEEKKKLVVAQVIGFFHELHRAIDDFCLAAAATPEVVDGPAEVALAEFFFLPLNAVSQKHFCRFVIECDPMSVGRFGGRVFFVVADEVVIDELGRGVGVADVEWALIVDRHAVKRTLWVVVKIHGFACVVAANRSRCDEECSERKKYQKGVGYSCA